MTICRGDRQRVLSQKDRTQPENFPHQRKLYSAVIFGRTRLPNS
ncbi:hypothetical protein AB0758_45605 [Tolypothrix bouteillei VB521301_2]